MILPSMLAAFCPGEWDLGRNDRFSLARTLHKKLVRFLKKRRANGRTPEVKTVKGHGRERRCMERANSMMINGKKTSVS